jgi:PKD repeat protein
MKKILISSSVVLLLTIVMFISSTQSVAASSTTTATTCEGTGVGTPYIQLYNASVNGLTATIDGYAVAGIPGPITWNWGDGQTTTGYFPQSHTYAKAGTYEVDVTVFDCTGGGKTATASQMVTVGAPLTSSSFSASAITSDAASNASQALLWAGFLASAATVALLALVLRRRSPQS